MDDIDPNKLYPASEACQLIPSPIAGKQICRKTLHSWRLAGKVFCVCREVTPRRRYWFVWGSEILRFLQADKKSRTPEQRQRAIDRNRKNLRAFGIEV